MSRHAVLWKELAVPPVVSPDAARAVLVGFAGLAGQPRIVLETVGSGGHLRWRLGTDSGPSLTRACHVFRTHVPGVLLQSPKSSPWPSLGKQAAAARLRAPRSRWLPLATRDRDIVSRSVLAALTSGGPGDVIRYQLVLGRRTRPRRAPERTEQRKADVDARHRQHGFGCTVRIAASGVDQQRATYLVRSVAAGLRPVEAPGVPLSLRRTSLGSVHGVSTPFFWPLWLSADDLVPLLSWPVSSDPRAELPGLPPHHPKLLPATSAHPTHGLVLGEASVSSGGAARPIAQLPADALKHRHVMGPTGVGKSTLLAQLALQDMQSGRGVVVVDPKGDLVTDLLARIPSDRGGDVVVLDPSSPRPLGLNPLQAADAELAADAIVAVFHSLYGEGLGPRSTDILHAAVLTLARRGDGCLPQVPLLLTNPAFRRTHIGQVTGSDALGLGAFWAGYEAQSQAERDAAIRPLLNKLRPIMLRPSLRAVFGQRTPAISLEQVLREQKILLVRLGKDRIGPEASTLLGSLFVAQLWQAILGRTRLRAARRKPVMVTIDEVQDYLRLPGSLGDALAQARGLGVGITAAHQHRGQLGRLVEDIDANTASKVYFRLAPSDARSVSGSMASGVLEPQDFQSLGAFQAYARLLVRDQLAPWVSLGTRPLPSTTGNATARQRASEARYGSPVEDVEAALMADGATGQPGRSATTETPLGRRRPRSATAPVAASEEGEA